MKNNTIFIFIFNFLFFNQSSNALSNTHKSFLHDDYLVKPERYSHKGFSKNPENKQITIPRQSGDKAGSLAPYNAQTPSPIESCVTQKKPLQSDNLEMQEVIQSLQKTLASQSETLQTKEELLQTLQSDNLEMQEVIQSLQKTLASQSETLQTKEELLQTTQTDLQKTRIFEENQRRESERIRAQLADLEKKNREAEEEKEAEKHLINSLQKALAQSKRKHANAQHIIKDDAEMDRSLLKSLNAISFIPEPQCRNNDEGKNNSTSKVSLKSQHRSQPKAYLRTAFGVPDFDAQDFDPQQKWEEDF